MLRAEQKSIMSLKLESLILNKTGLFEDHFVL